MYAKGSESECLTARKEKVMSKFDKFLALFQPVLTTAVMCAGVYLWRMTNTNALGYVGILFVLAGILSIVFYAKKLRGLPEAKLINSPETDILRVYMRGGLIASFIPQAMSVVLIIAAHINMPNDGVSAMAFLGGYAVFLALPFVCYPFIVFIMFQSGFGISAYDVYTLLILLIVCLITRTVMQSMCFLATNRRIDYENSRFNGIAGSMLGTINVIFWLGCLSRVKKFAKIELEKGICQ